MTKHSKWVSNNRLREAIDRWEYEKPRLVIWTDQDEEILQVYKELLKLREEAPDD